MTHISRERAREILLRSDDRTLADAGFSRALLEDGIHAWPWRDELENSDMPPIQFDLIAQKQAIRELQSYDDKELSDLGIARGAITDAVKHGRVGIEQETPRKVA